MYIYIRARNATLYSACKKPGGESFDYTVVVERVLSLFVQSGNRLVSLCTRYSSKVSRDIARGL